MKCQILFPGKNKKNISKYRLQKILPRVLRVKCLLGAHVRRYFFSCITASTSQLICNSDLNNMFLCSLKMQKKQQGTL